MYPQTNLKLKFSMLEMVAFFFDVNSLGVDIFSFYMKHKYFLIEIFILRIFVVVFSLLGSVHQLINHTKKH